MNKTFLQLEGFIVLALSLYFYHNHHYSWILFFILLFAPDISMIGYLVNNKIGALLYNVFHTYTISILVVFCGLLLPNETVLAVGLVWTAHIGMDRMMGYGLKYPTKFKDTHLNRV